MTELMNPYTDEHGVTWYPVRHALGAIVSSLSRESQLRWQEFADKQEAKLLEKYTAAPDTRPSEMP